ncbi:hypothetical protein CY0110_19267 [Crocosphaera chwakensis CCY0110]|uniref:Uncharacterized protein n=1 Tax=Crocosphaera chwakensis CCY0110 TaxID=391612 RepID=A3IJI5_9CHRO|nr:hypothetical protein CY0110_19267 [Crocosphaera chwakensis CCY0110]
MTPQITKKLERLNFAIKGIIIVIIYNRVIVLR